MTIHDRINKSLNQVHQPKTQQSESKEKCSPLEDKQKKILESLDELEAKVKEFAKGKKVSNPAKQARLEQLIAQLK